MSKTTPVFVGLDVHKETISVAAEVIEASGVFGSIPAAVVSRPRRAAYAVIRDRTREGGCER